MNTATQLRSLAASSSLPLRARPAVSPSALPSAAWRMPPASAPQTLGAETAPNEINAFLAINPDGIDPDPLAA